MNDRYEVGKKSALQQFDGDASREAILSSAMIARADLYPDEFTAGWLAACEEKMQELYGESTEEFLND